MTYPNQNTMEYPVFILLAAQLYKLFIYLFYNKNYEITFKIGEKILCIYHKNIDCTEELVELDPLENLYVLNNL